MRGTTRKMKTISKKERKRMRSFSCEIKSEKKGQLTRRDWNEPIKDRRAKRRQKRRQRDVVERQT